MKRFHRLYFAAAVALLAFLTLRLAAIAWNFTTDDAYITFKYGRSLAEGLGIVWNPGEPPVEGYSNFTFVVLSALFSFLGVDPVIPIKIINLASLAGSLYLSYLVTSIWVGPLLSLVPPFILALFFEGPVFWASSGLETAFFSFLSFLALYLSLRFLAGGGGREPKELARSAVILGLLLVAVAMTRPEGGLFFGIIMLCAWMGYFLPSLWKENRWKGAEFREFLGFNLRVAGTFLLAFGGYWLWRYGYFGYPFPNPYYCKVATYSGREATFLVDEIMESASLYLLAGAAAVVLSRDLRIAALFLPAVAYVYLLRGVDPIVGYFHRHFIAALTALLPLTAVLVHEAAKRVARGRIDMQKVEAILFTAFLFLVPQNYLRVEESIKKNVDRYAIRTDTRVRTAGYLSGVLPAGASYVNGDEGLIPYLTPDLSSIDAYCLNDLALAHRVNYNDEDEAAKYFLSRTPEAIVMISNKPDQNVPKDKLWKGLLRSPEFKENYVPGEVFGGRGDTFFYFTYLRKPPPVENGGKAY